LVAVVLSHDAPPHRAALEAFLGHLAASRVAFSHQMISLTSDPAAAARDVQALRSKRPDLYLTLGNSATQAVARIVRDTPIVSGLVVHAQDIEQGRNLSGVHLEHSAETQLQWMRKLLPDHTRLGVIYNPRENRERILHATRAARDLGIVLETVEVHSAQEIPAALRSLEERVGGLWGVPDGLVLTPSTARQILLFSYRNRIPVIGPSASWAKAGALYALDWDFGDLGKQCAEMVLQVLGGREIGALPRQAPRKLIYVVNAKAAAHMKIDLPQDVLGKAAQVY
jgi:putative ABC transport system substrate-binding protein